MHPDHPHHMEILVRAWLQRDEPGDALAAMHRETRLAATGMLADLVTLHAFDTDRGVDAGLEDIGVRVSVCYRPELL